MFKKQILAAAVLAAIGLAAHAADSFNFDTNGAALGGEINNAVTFDWSPGNALAVNGTQAGGLQVGDTSTLLYQANLATIKDGATPVANILYTNGVGGTFFTAVAGFGERANAVALGGAFASFEFDPLNPTNFFYIYAKTSGGSDLAGTGFTTGNIAGTILRAHVVSVTVSNFQTNGVISPLDNFGTNNYPTITTLNGAGSTTLTAFVDYADPNYFKSLSGGLVNFTFSAFNNSQVLPFDQTDPSALFSSNGVLDGNLAANIGTINGVDQGTDKNFIFQADANQSFTVQQKVPEPASLALVGLGLVGLGVVTRRRQRKLDQV